MLVGQRAAVDASACANCGTALQGEYCHACGQRPPERDELTLRHAARHAADEVLHLESKTLRSLLQLLRPGALTEAYLDGRRAPYTSPMKVFVVCAAIFFVCAPLAGFTLEQMLAGDTSGMLKTWIDRTIATKGLDRDVFAERFNLRIQTVYTVSLFVAILGTAGMLALLYRRQGRPFGAHIVFELHYYAFLCLAAIVIGAILRPFPPLPLVSLLATLAVLAPYLYLALRRVYRESAGRTLWKMAALVFFALLFDNLINFLALVVTLWLV